MVNDELPDCALVMCEGEEDGYVDEAPEGAEVDDDDTETAIATEMRRQRNPAMPRGGITSSRTNHFNRVANSA